MSPLRELLAGAQTLAAVILVTLSGSLAGCGAVDDRNHDSNHGLSGAHGGDDGGADAGAETDAPPTPLTPRGSVRLSVTLFGTDVPRVEGATICRYPDVDVCVTTGASGNAEISLPERQKLALTIVASGHQSLVTMITTPDAEGHVLALGTAFTMRDRATMDALLGLSGSSIDASHGAIETQVAVVGSTVSGIREILSPSHGPAIYLGEDGRPASSLTATSKSGGAWFGSLPAGDYQLAFDDPSGACEADTIGWAGDEAGTSAVLVLAGFLTETVADCP